MLGYWLLGVTLMAQAQADLLQSGPMLGYSTMREVLLWVQTKQAADVYFRYWETGKTDQKQQTETIRTRKDEAFTARLTASPLEPGKTYDYALYINGKEVKRPYPMQFQSQALWQYRTDPPNFSFVFGSCFYINEEAYDRPGRGYGGDYQIVDAIGKQKADFMLWGGDNVYLREPDWDSQTGIFHRYTHTRSLPQLQPLLANMHHYATWDDHEFGPNDSDRSYPLKHLTERTFNLFWGNLNTNITGQGGVTNHFSWADCDFFLLDNRYFRSPNRRRTGERVMLGDAQIEWLLDALRNSRAPFKFVVMGGQTVNDFAFFENYAIYPEERARLLKGIEAEEIEGVIFLSGDRHHTILSKLDRPRKYPLYDLTSSALTAGSHTPDEDENSYRVPGTLVSERNFAKLSVSGERKDRVLQIEVFNAQGERLWEHRITAKELRLSKD